MMKHYEMTAYDNITDQTFQPSSAIYVWPIRIVNLSIEINLVDYEKIFIVYRYLMAFLHVIFVYE